VVDVDVLDHRDLELPGQEQDREHGEKGRGVERGQGAREPVARSPDDEERLDPG
jgi:hypothetical protein